MKNKYKMKNKLLLLFLILTMVVTSIPFNNTAAYAETETETGTGTADQYEYIVYGNAEYDLLSNSISKPSYIVIGGLKYKINIELFNDKGLLVYGDYNDVINHNGNNDFKQVKNGYYTQGKYVGLYRYHGFTESGGLYSADDFPVDSDSGRTVSQKEWIYNYWVQQDENISSVTEFVTEQTDFFAELAREQIDNMIPDVLANSTNNDARKSTNGNNGYSVADHMNVFSLSSTLFNGEGKMMQENAGTTWYQMFSTEKQVSKTEKPHTLKVEIVDKGSYNFTNDDTTTVKVKLSGVYEDSDIDLEVDQIVYYHIGDIKEYTLNLQIGTETFTEVGKPNSQDNGNSMFTHTFDIEVSENDLTDGNLIANGESYILFHDDIITNSAIDMDTDSIEGGIKSIFSVSDVELSEPEGGIPPVELTELTREKVKYFDSSIGKIVRYEITVINEVSKREQSLIYGADPSDFETDLFTFLQGENGVYGHYLVTQTVKNNLDVSDTSTDTFTIRKKVLEAVELDLSIPSDVIDVDKVTASDNTDYSEIGWKSQSIKIDGVEVDWNTYFSGQFSYGEIDNEFLSIIEVSVISEDDVESIRTTATLVHSSLPKSKLDMSGTNKVNRKMTLTNNSNIVNDPYVVMKYPNTYTITYSAIGDSSMTDFKIKDISTNQKDVLFKKDGFYRASITATNIIGRSNTTHFDIGILPDYAPNIIFNIWNNVLTRNETLNISYEAVSVDGDIISTNKFEIYFDENSDGVAEKLVFESTDPTLPYTPTKLGYYKVVNYVEESFGEETIAEFINESDKVGKTVERVFYVDNLRPLTDFDVDIPENFQQIDLYFLSDQNLNDDNIQDLRNNRINYNNALRLYGLDVKAEYRDLKTYTTTQPISTSQYYGSSYPPSTKAYSANGLTGTLSRYSVTNNSYQDYYTTEESYRSCSTTNVFNGYVNCDSTCLWQCKNVGGSGCDDGCCDSDYTQRTSCTTEYETVRHYYTVNRYTGYYSGTASKSVKQPYTNPFRELSEKYVIYVTDDSGFNLTEYNALKGNASFKTIVIGSNAVKAQINDEIKFIYNDGSDINELVQQAIDEIGSLYPFSSTYLIEKGDTFNINDINFDTEGDALITHGYQYVQNQVFDNSLGIEPGARGMYSDNIEDFSNVKATQFNTVGNFQIFRLVSDSTGQAQFDKRSNLANISILVHRKPIADYTLDWTYNTSTNKYDVIFVDTSYDLDHEFNDPQKGIRETTAMYRKNGGAWIYAIPSNLTDGDYEFRWSVKDMENTWSLPKITNFTLSLAPPVQLMDAKLKARLNEFSLNSIPASEDITFYDVESRYPQNTHLAFGIYKNGVLVTPQLKKNFSGADTKVGQDIAWSDTNYNIPKTLADGTYEARVYLIDSNNSSNFTYKAFNITVKTPINLYSYINDAHIDSEVYIGEDNLFKATTTQYVESVELTALGNSIQMTLLENNPTEKVWGHTISVDPTTPEGFGSAVFKATTYNNTVESEMLNYEMKIALEIEGTVVPNPCLSGELITFTFTTQGAAERVLLDLNSFESGLVVELTPTSPIATKENTWIYEYIVPLDTNDGTYSTSAVALKGARNESASLDIVVVGSILDLIDPRDREGN